MKQFVAILLSALGSLLPALVYAQYDLPENKIWVFGWHEGLDFNGPMPQPISPSIQGAIAGASVCDASGKLLFYTDGASIWNRNGKYMPQSDSVIAPGSLLTTDNADGALIVGVPDSVGKYYVFSLTSNQNYTNGLYAGASWLFYSEVDMALDNGLGDIVPKRKWMLLDTALSTKMVAVQGNNCNVWLVVHDGYTNMFKAYEMTWKGLNPNPIISYTGMVFPPTGLWYWRPWDQGEFTISPDRKTLAGAYWANQAGVAELYDFDASTGKVSNAWVIDSSGQAADLVGATFSPNNSKFYTTHLLLPGNSYTLVYDIYQFDLSLGSHAAARFSQTRIARGQTDGELRLAGDGKIYYKQFQNSRQYGVIESPDLPGVNCQINTTAFVAPPNTFSGTAMGNEFARAAPNPHPDTTAYTQLDTCVSSGPLEGFTLHAPQGDFIDYTWDDNTSDSLRIVNRPGSYSVTCVDRCMNATKVAYIITPMPSFTLGADTAVCTWPLSLRVDIAGGSYLWSNGSIADSMQVFGSGTYWATVNKNECHYTDTIQVKQFNVYQDLGKDQRVCNDAAVEVTLSAQVPDGARALWSTGSTTTDIMARDTGIYWVTVTAQQCTGSDTLHIAGEPCNCRFAAPTAFSPNGDGTNDFFRLIVERNCPVQSYSITIYNRWGQRVYTGTSLETGWDGTSNGQPQDIGTYSYIVEFSVGTKSNHYFQKGEVTLVR